MKRLLLLALLLLAACGIEHFESVEPSELYGYSISYVDYCGIFWQDCIVRLEWVDSSGPSCLVEVPMAEPLVAVPFETWCEAFHTEYQLHTRNGVLLDRGVVQWRQMAERQWTAVIVFATCQKSNPPEAL